jgi:hypothetical protein
MQTPCEFINAFENLRRGVDVPFATDFLRESVGLRAPRHLEFEKVK